MQIMDALKTHPTATAIVVLIASYIGSFVVRLIQHRKKFKNLVGFSSLERQCRSYFEYEYLTYLLLNFTPHFMTLTPSSLQQWSVCQ